MPSVFVYNNFDNIQFFFCNYNIVFWKETTENHLLRTYLYFLLLFMQNTLMDFKTKTSTNKSFTPRHGSM